MGVMPTLLVLPHVPFSSPSYVSHGPPLKAIVYRGNLGQCLCIWLKAHPRPGSPYVKSHKIVRTPICLLKRAPPGGLVAKPSTSFHILFSGTFPRFSFAFLNLSKTITFSFCSQPPRTISFETLKFPKVFVSILFGRGPLAALRASASIT